MGPAFLQQIRLVLVYGVGAAVGRELRLEAQKSQETGMKESQGTDLQRFGLKLRRQVLGQAFISLFGFFSATASVLRVQLPE